MTPRARADVDDCSSPELLRAVRLQIVPEVAVPLAARLAEVAPFVCEAVGRLLLDPRLWVGPTRLLSGSSSKNVARTRVLME